VSDSWDDRAAEEFDKPDEPISARASDLTKFGAPVAAFIVTVAAAAGGVASDAPPAESVIAVAIVVATAVAGLFYVFAADFRSRAAATVARFQMLGKLAAAEAQATKDAQADADRRVGEAKAEATAHIEDADKAKAEAQKEEAAATEARESAAAKETAAQATLEENADLKEALKRCEGERGADDSGAVELQMQSSPRRTRTSRGSPTNCGAARPHQRRHRLLRLTRKRARR
jgi:hypothetical protein